MVEIAGLSNLEGIVRDEVSVWYRRGVARAVPASWSAVRFRGKVLLLQAGRLVRNRGAVAFPDLGDAATHWDVLLGESVGALWGGDEGGAERALTLGKVQNLRVAVRRLHGVVIPAERTFSFWTQVGRATKRRGYVAGRELREGCIVPSVGGGLCQLSNALYDAALRAGFEIVERHAHSAIVPGSAAAVGRDATVFWNYVDLRFRAACDVRIEAVVGSDRLSIRFWGERRADTDASERHDGAARDDVVALSVVADAGAGVRGCASCGMDSCFRHRRLQRARPGVERTAFLVDEYWPEFDAYVGATAGERDVLFLPMDGKRFGRAAYAWDVSRFEAVCESRVLTVLRGVRSRGLAAQGAARQRALLSSAQRLGESFGARLPYDVSHVVVMQHLLPALWRGGHLGGRTYDVLMTGLPMLALQRELDAAFRLHPDSPTLADFRADARLLDDEAAALAGASRIVTPHAAVAAEFGARAVRLPWASAEAIRRSAPEPAAVEYHVQAAVERVQAPLAEGNSIVFPAATLGRKGAYEVRDAVRELGSRVIVCGPDLEGAGFWDGVAMERAASYRDTLARGSAVVLPAFVENQPRRLLLAMACGVPVVASSACGLDDGNGVTVVTAGDAAALVAALAAFTRPLLPV